MRIGELGRRAGVHTHQLRYYEAQGLLEPGRGSNGYREYSDDDVLTVYQIRKLLGAGLSTEEIAYMLPCVSGVSLEIEPCSELMDVLNARLDGLDERIDTLTRSRRALHDFIKNTEMRAPQNCETTHSDAERAAHPMVSPGGR
ncbi:MULTISPECIES: MerR family transcriptional regulator [Actinomadura]|uniref:MerR family transcriptional regulator n=1 Tax=Actinomadura litoris TaxID=2678616 RepID=A0A7K1LDM7_9ACTN|nr:MULTISPECIES: MerR family transcriptional regulator [Actinomadura]MBT2210214.1 MerR family transcriptional regulator [Actinomadura sp. NEAU-AAG7]MUN42522.1 MerR family transcriptional regulator [Actinomadura litoris]